LAYSIVWRS
jgi:hypothetical protein